MYTEVKVRMKLFTGNEAKRQWSNTFKVLKEKLLIHNSTPRVYMFKIYFENKREIKTF